MLQFVYIAIFVHKFSYNMAMNAAPEMLYEYLACFYLFSWKENALHNAFALYFQLPHFIC